MGAATGGVVTRVPASGALGAGGLAAAVGDTGTVRFAAMVASRFWRIASVALSAAAEGESSRCASTAAGRAVVGVAGEVVA